MKHRKLNNLEAIDETDSFCTDKSFVSEEMLRSKRNMHEMSPVRKYNMISEISEQEFETEPDNLF